MNAWFILGAAGAIAFGLRWAIVLVAARRPISETVVALSGLVAPSIAAALLAGALVRTETAADLPLQVVAVVVGGVVAWRTRSVLLTLGAGLAAYALLGLLS